jgi:WD40 repeat protein
MPVSTDVRRRSRRLRRWVVPAALAALAVAALLTFRTSSRPTALPPHVTLGTKGPAAVPLAFSTDGSKLATRTRNDLIVWDLATRQIHYRRTDPKFNGGSAAAFSPEGRRIASLWFDTGTKCSVITVDDLDRAAEVARLTLDRPGVVPWNPVFSADGSVLSVVSYNNIASETVALLHSWETATWARREDRPLRATIGPGFKYHRSTFTTDSGSLLATLGIAASRVGISAARFSADGARLVVAREDHTLEVWDVMSRHLTKTLRGEPGRCRVVDLMLTDDPSTLVTLGLDRTTPGTRLMYTLSRISPLLFGRTNRTLSPDIRSELVVWDLEAGKPRAVIPDIDVNDAVSPDGRRLATTLRDGTIDVWDIPPK